MAETATKTASPTPEETIARKRAEVIGLQAEISAMVRELATELGIEVQAEDFAGLRKPSLETTLAQGSGKKKGTTRRFAVETGETTEPLTLSGEEAATLTLIEQIHTRREAVRAQVGKLRKIERRRTALATGIQQIIVDFLISEGSGRTTSPELIIDVIQAGERTGEQIFEHVMHLCNTHGAEEIAALRTRWENFLTEKARKSRVTRTQRLKENVGLIKTSSPTRIQAAEEILGMEAAAVEMPKSASLAQQLEKIEAELKSKMGAIRIPGTKTTVSRTKQLQKLLTDSLPTPTAPTPAKGSKTSPSKSPETPTDTKDEPSAPTEASTTNQTQKPENLLKDPKVLALLVIFLISGAFLTKQIIQTQFGSQARRPAARSAPASPPPPTPAANTPPALPPAPVERAFDATGTTHIDHYTGPLSKIIESYTDEGDQSAGFIHNIAREAAAKRSIMEFTSEVTPGYSFHSFRKDPTDRAVIKISYNGTGRYFLIPGIETHLETGAETLIYRAHEIGSGRVLRPRFGLRPIPLNPQAFAISDVSTGRHLGEIGAGAINGAAGIADEHVATCLAYWLETLGPREGITPPSAQEDHQR